MDISCFFTHVSLMFSPMFSHVLSPMPSHLSPSICSTQYHASDCGQNWPYGPDSQSEGRWIHGLDFLSVGAKRLGEALLWGFWPSALQWVFLWLDLHIHLMRLFTHVVGQCWKMTRSRESLFFSRRPCYCESCVTLYGLFPALDLHCACSILQAVQL